MTSIFGHPGKVENVSLLRLYCVITHSNGFYWIIIDLISQKKFVYNVLKVIAWPKVELKSIVRTTFLTLKIYCFPRIVRWAQTGLKAFH